VAGRIIEHTEKRGDIRVSEDNELFWLEIIVGLMGFAILFRLTHGFLSPSAMRFPGIGGPRQCEVYLYLNRAGIEEVVTGVMTKAEAR
jgi:hypothetical protein